MIRQVLPELMDDPRLDGKAHAHALGTLNRVNRMLRVHHRLYRCIGQLSGGGEVSILDLGTGGGGFLGYVSNRMQHQCGHPRLVGLDLSAQAIRCARRWHSGAIRWLVADARNIPLADNSIDIVTCSLFLHHFSEVDVVRILCEAARVARRGIVVDDLSRSRLALGLTWLGTRVLGRSHVFHVDGPRSVHAAFRQQELADLPRRAGLDGARLEKRFPFRLILTWKKPENQSV